MMQWIVAALARGGRKTGCVVTLTGTQNASDDQIDPTDASATLSVGSSLVTGTTNGSTAWRTDTVCDTNLYEAELVISGDAPTSGDSTGSGNWTTLPASWTWTQTVVGTKSATYTLTVREIADTGNSGSCTGAASANVDPPE